MQLHRPLLSLLLQPQQETVNDAPRIITNITGRENSSITESDNKGKAKSPKRVNPLTASVLRNCQDVLLWKQNLLEHKSQLMD